MTNERCKRCGRSVPPFDGVIQSDGQGTNLGFVCGRCWSAILGERTGSAVAHVEIEPIVMRDAAGKTHEFHFRYSPVPRGIEAFELIEGVPGGYQFQVLQEDDDPGIVGELLARMRRSLARQHLAPCDLQPGGLRIKDSTVRGRIAWDPGEDGQVPALVIDGKQLSWSEFGSMLMTFEGWQFRLQLFDPSEAT